MWTRQQLPHTIAVPEGALTLDTAARLRRSLLTCLSECPDAVVVELSRLTADSDLPLALFREIHRQASTWPAVPLLMCAPSPALSVRLARTGLHRVIPVHATVAEATGAAAAGPATLARADHDLFPDVTAPARARAIVTDLCRASRLPFLTGPATLIISELVTNAVTHAPGPMRIIAVHRHPDLHLVVRDCSPTPPRRRGLPPPGEGSPLAISGRGLHLLQEAAHSWGYLSHGTGKVVWARLRKAFSQPSVDS